jgi:iron complex outermembrane receptor protein
MSRIALLIFLLMLAWRSDAGAQGGAGGTLRGTVTLEDSGRPVHGVAMTIVQLQRTVVTGEDGSYEFRNIPPGAYEVRAHLDRVPEVLKTFKVEEGGATDGSFRLQLRGAGEQIIVTASGEEESSLLAVRPVVSLSSLELAERSTQSLGDALDNQLGIAKRSFGPGTSRPVVRGFDGDRVLVLQDGNRIGSLGFQSGDHAEPIDILTLDKIEVVKGPATLLYGSSAMGGVVNAITGLHDAHPGARAYLTGLSGTNSYPAGGSAGVEYGTEKWLFWVNGGGQRSGDYNTPAGRVINSFARQGNGSGGFGYYPGHGFFSLDFTVDRRRYGIPFDVSEADPEVVYLNPKRQSIHLDAGVSERDWFVRGAEVSLQYNDYRHDEIDSFTDAVNTAFKNKTLDFRTVLDQRRVGKWSGSFGVWGLHRDYDSAGEEALAPPTTQNAVALFVLEKLDFERVSLQWGGRFEHNGYAPSPLPGRATPERSFNGFSTSAGLSVGLWKNGAFAANYSHSYRAPSLEELYNDGPHPGNATFEIGNPDLKRERGDGLDLSLRHLSDRLRTEVNYFYYHLSDFVFLAPTGEIEDGLIEAAYSQATSRYTGVECRFDAALHSGLWLVSKLDYVNAELTQDGTPLPRIPPLRGSVGIEASHKGLRFLPEVVMSNRQDRIFPTETATPGYAVLNVTASYTIAQKHTAHVFSVSSFNLGDRLYRNHLSFIKQFAPEIGRGIRFTYMLRFY